MVGGNHVDCVLAGQSRALERTPACSENRKDAHVGNISRMRAPVILAGDLFVRSYDKAWVNSRPTSLPYGQTSRGPHDLTHSNSTFLTPKTHNTSCQPPFVGTAARLFSPLKDCRHPAPNR
jgi:hypothetical protein